MNRKEGRKKVFRPMTFLIVLILISASFLIFATPAQGNVSWFTEIFLGLQRFIGKLYLSLKDIIKSIFNLREVTKLYNESIIELEQFRGLDRKLQELNRENKILRDTIGLAKRIVYENIPVQIIGDDPTNIFDTLTIDKGLDNGIEIGMAVTSFQGGFVGLLGKVVFVARNTAHVRPIVDQNHYVAARFQISRFIGLVEGRGREDGTLLMRYVNKTANPLISVNDIIVTSGTESVYPPNIIIGRLKEIRSKEYSSSLELILEPVINLARVEYAYVLTGRDAEGF